MREKFPEIHFQSMVKLALVHRVELGQPKEFDKPRTVEEALAQLEEPVGTKERRLFEDFLRKAERLEAEENVEAVHAEDTADLPVLRPTRRQRIYRCYVHALSAHRPNMSGNDIRATRSPHDREQSPL
jgi:hypothetical protein